MLVSGVYHNDSDILHGNMNMKKYVCMYSSSSVHSQSCLTFSTPWTVVHQAPLSMGFPRQEYWSRLPFPPPRDLPDLGIKPMSLCILHCRKRALLVICFMYSKIVVCVC